MEDCKAMWLLRLSRVITINGNTSKSKFMLWVWRQSRDQGNTEVEQSPGAGL